MANPVVSDDVANRWRSLTSAEDDLVGYLLGDAWQILLARVPDLETRIDDATLDTSLVVAVEAAMVLRVMRNPDGKRQESIDDYSWTRDNAVSAGFLYLSDDELALLAPAGALSNAFSITPYSETYIAEAGTSTVADLDLP